MRVHARGLVLLKSVKGAPQLLCLVLMLCFVLPLHAQERHALVIGNAAYKGMTPLTNPVNDATDIAAALKDLGFVVDLVKDASLSDMEAAVVSLGDRLKRAPGSWGFFYYAGHGVQSSDGENYLIPVDATIPAEAFLKSRALANQVVLDILQDARNALNVIILDACRDNPFSWSRSASRGLSVVRSQPPGSIIAYATSAGSVAQDGLGRNGLFTAQLLKHLKTPGLEIKDVFNRTGKSVQDASSSKQVPAVYNQFFETAYLAGAPAPVKPIVETRIERVVVAANANEVPGGPWYRSTSFEDGEVAPWGPRAVSGEIVTLSSEEYRSGSHSLKVSNRRMSVQGIKGPLLSKDELESGWEANAWVKYVEGPPSALLQSTIEYIGTDGKGFKWIPLAPTLVRRGEWTLLSGTFAVAKEDTVESVVLGFETCFRDANSKHPENSLEFWVDDISIRKIPVEMVPSPLVLPLGRTLLFSDQSRSRVSVMRASASVEPRTLSWLSSEPSIALVTPSGELMGMGPGHCYILVKDQNNQQAALEVEVLDASRYRLFSSLDFAKKSQANKILSQKTMDYSKNPPQSSAAVLKRLYESNGGVEADGAVRLDFEREDYGFVDIHLRFKPGQIMFPAGSIIVANMKSDLEGAQFMMGMIGGSPDWKWTSENTPYISVSPGLWTPVLWRLDKPFAMASDGELRFILKKDHSSKRPGEKGSFWIDDLKVWVPLD